MHYHHQFGVLVPFAKKHFKIIVLALAGIFILSQVFLISGSDKTQAAAPLAFNQGFEIDNSGWSSGGGYGTITRVANGTGGISSADGAYHATVASTDSGPYTNFGGYRNTWTGEWETEVDVYLDPAWVNGSGFDWSVAANGSDGFHQRDYVFHVTKDTSTGKLLVAGSNNTNFAPREDLEALNHFEIGSAGWYTLQHRFYNDAGSLSVDLNLLDSLGAVLFTETRSDVADAISTEVGGNRYGWFTVATVPGELAIDNTSLYISNETPVVTDCSSITQLHTTDLTTWDLSETRATGHNEIVDDGLRIWTEGTTSTDKAAGYYAVNFPLSGLGSQTIAEAIDYAATFGIDPGLQLVIDFDNNGIPDGILVGEAVYSNSWWLSNSATQFVKDNSPNTGGGYGSSWYGTPDEWLSKFPDARVLAIGYSLGSGVHGDGVIKHINLGCVDYSFGPEQGETLPDCQTTEWKKWSGWRWNKEEIETCVEPPTCDVIGVTATKKIKTIKVKYQDGSKQEFKNIDSKSFNVPQGSADNLIVEIKIKPKDKDIWITHEVSAPEGCVDPEPIENCLTAEIVQVDQRSYQSQQDSHKKACIDFVDCDIVTVLSTKNIKKIKVIYQDDTHEWIDVPDDTKEYDVPQGTADNLIVKLKVMIKTGYNNYKWIELDVAQPDNCGEVLSECSLTLFSDTSSTVNDGPAVLVSSIPAGWTANVSGTDDAKWIWSEDPVPSEKQLSGDTQTFKKTFYWGGANPISSAELKIASDNGYKVFINGIERFADPSEKNYVAADTHDISSYITPGWNTLEFEVFNWPWNSANPAGLLYKVVVNGSAPDCDQPQEPPVEECVPVPGWAEGVLFNGQGTTKSGGAIQAARTNPENALGSPDDKFFSLGVEGYIDVEFDGYVLNVDGNDLSFHEITNLTNPIYPEEKADVYVSQTGSSDDWHFAGTVNNNGGLGGVNYLDFDSTGLDWVKYVRVSEASNFVIHDGNADGYDLDAVDATAITCKEPQQPPKLQITLCKKDLQGAALAGWTLMLLGDKVEDVVVPVNTPTGIDTAASLSAGTPYVAIAEGTWENRRSPLNLVDAEYSTEDSWATVMDGFTGYGTDILELQINSGFDPGSAWGDYNSLHRYAQPFTVPGDGSANFRIYDGNPTPTVIPSWYGDNFGQLNVAVYVGYVGVTDENGCVTFTDVPSGEYTVDEIMQDGWGNVSGLGNVIVDEDQTFTVVNNQTESEIEQLGLISGFVYNDQANNKQKDPDDPYLKDWTIWLMTHNSPYTIVAYDITGEDGAFSFENLPYGTYFVCQDIQEGWTQTELPAGNNGIVGNTSLIGVELEIDDALVNQYCYPVVLSAENSSSTDNIFGNYNTLLGVTDTNDPDDEGDVLAEEDGEVLAETGSPAILALVVGFMLISSAIVVRSTKQQ